jgi:hypothetical protein
MFASKPSSLSPVETSSPAPDSPAKVFHTSTSPLPSLITGAVAVSLALNSTESFTVLGSVEERPADAGQAAAPAAIVDVSVGQFESVAFHHGSVSSVVDEDGGVGDRVGDLGVRSLEDLVSLTAGGIRPRTACAGPVKSRDFDCLTFVSLEVLTGFFTTGTVPLKMGCVGETFELVVAADAAKTGEDDETGLNSAVDSLLCV